MTEYHAGWQVSLKLLVMKSPPADVGGRSLPDGLRDLALALGRAVRDSPFPNHIIRWRLKDGTYLEARKIQHQFQKVYWSKLGEMDSWDEEPPH